ncbi:hypothetical protein GCM10027030_11750 [Luteococcus sediminum]
MRRHLIPDGVITLLLVFGLGAILSLDTWDALWVSNVSLTWLLIPLWFGWRTGRLGKGAAWGLMITQAALVAYYIPASAGVSSW